MELSRLGSKGYALYLAALIYFPPIMFLSNSYICANRLYRFTPAFLCTYKLASAYEDQLSIVSPFPFTDVVALKGSYFDVSNSTLNVADILQTDLLCTGHEDNLLKCNNNGIGTHMCPEDHSEDAGVKCNGMIELCICMHVHHFYVFIHNACSASGMLIALL